jgi:DNA polymerase-3 subunit gamma/tau
MLSNAAFNALLKTLEEPPGHVIFIFATTETHKVPATILSRCQCFDFRRIPLKIIADNLKKIAAADGIRISDSALAWIAEAGDGSLRDSQSIFDQVISYAGFDIVDQAVEEVLGRSDRRFLFLLSGAVLGRDAAQCLKIIDEAYYAGIDMLFFYQTLIGHFRNLLLAAITNAQETLVDLPAEEVEKLKQQSAGSSQETLQRYLQILTSEEDTLRRSPNPRLNLEAIFCRLAWLEPLIPIASILSRMEDLERRLEGGDAPSGGAAGSLAEGPQVPDRLFPNSGAVSKEDGGGPMERAAAGQSRREEDAGMSHEPSTGGSEKLKRSSSPGREALPPGPVSSERIGPPGGNAAAAARGGWSEFKAYVTRQQPALGAKLESAQCLSCTEGTLRIGFAEGYLFRDDVEAEKTILENLAREFFRQETGLQVATLASDSPEAAKNGINGNGVAGRAAKNHELRELRREALSNPLVLKILDLFPRAEVKDVRVREMPEAGDSASPTAPAGEEHPPDGTYAGLSEEMPD